MPPAEIHGANDSRLESPNLPKLSTENQSLVCPRGHKLTESHQVDRCQKGRAGVLLAVLT